MSLNIRGGGGSVLVPGGIGTEVKGCPVGPSQELMAYCMHINF